MYEPLDDQSVVRYRRLFPITESELINFNHAGVAPTSTVVREAVDRWFQSAELGVDFDDWERGSERCRERFARLVACSPDEVAFVRNTSHGLSLVAESIPWQDGDRIAVAPGVEYPSNVHPWKYLARDGKRRVVVDEIPHRHGGVHVDAVRQTLRPETKLVAVSSAQYGSGAVTDLKAIGGLCRERGILFCVDGIQTLGALPMDVREANIDFLAADSHKWLLGVTGIGGLYVRKELVLGHAPLSGEMIPPLVGWKSMIGGWDFKAERDQLLPHAGRFEEGSPGYPLIEGFSAALELLLDVSVEAIAARLRALIDHVVDGLEAQGCTPTTPRELHHHFVCFTHPSKSNAEVIDALRAAGIMVTNRGHGVRISPHFYNTTGELDRLLNVVAGLGS